jgi:hypothetical protein
MRKKLLGTERQLQLVHTKRTVLQAVVQLTPDIPTHHELG